MYNCWRKTVRWVVRLYVWATHRLYNEFAWAYDPVSWLVSLGRWGDWRRTALDYVIGHRILEVGFGTGELLIEMAHRGLHAYGLECSPAMQRVTARKMRRNSHWATRVRGVVQKMPFADESFDSIISTFPAEYILDPATLCQVARLLRRPDPRTATCGGRFIVVGLIPGTSNSLLRRATRLVFGTPKENVLARYERMVTAAGLRITVTTPNGKGLRMPVIILEKW